MLRHRALVLVAVTLVTGALGWTVTQLPVVTAIRDYIPEDARGRLSFEAARERFGGEEVIFVAVEASDHFTEEGRARIQAVTSHYEDHPLVDRVLSLSSAQRMWSEGDTLRIERWFDGDDPAAIARDERIAGTLISEDRQLALFGLEMIPSEARFAAEPAVRAAMNEQLPAAAALGDRAAPPGTLRSMLDMSKQAFSIRLADGFAAHGYDAAKTHVVGFTPVLAHMVENSRQNLEVLFPITLLLIALTLWWLLRRGTEAVIPLLAVVPAVIWAVALGGLATGRLSILTSMAPVMVLVVGVSDVVHLITQFTHERVRGLDVESSIRVAFKKVGAACALTSLTTLLGFGSMILLPLPMSRELGVFAGLGVATAFVLSFVITPIALSVLRHPPLEETHRVDRLSLLLELCARMVRRHPVAIAGAGAVISLATVAVGMTVTFENSLTRKLAPDHPLRRSVVRVDEALSGSVEIEMLVDGGAAGAMESEAMFAALTTLAARVEAHPGIEQIFGLHDVIEQVHEEMGGEMTEGAVSQYLLLFEMSGGSDLDKLVDDTRRHARYSIRTRDGTAEGLVAIADEIEVMAAEIMPEGATVEMNGLAVLAARLGPRILSTSLQGFSFVLALIALLMAVLFRSARVGLLSLIPNMLPVGLGVVAVHVVFELVDADTLTFLAICIGVAVDDTIHFLARYRIERSTRDVRSDAVSATILEAGHGIVRTTVILVAGFSVLAWSDYVPLATMGWMLPITLASAVLLDLTLLPAMVELGLIDPGARTPASTVQPSLQAELTL